MVRFSVPLLRWLAAVRRWLRHGGLRRWLKPLPCARLHPGAQLVLELLEGRTQPANTWVGASTGLWETPSNWSGGAAPVLTDDVIIGSGVTVTHASTNADSVNSINDAGTLVVGAGSLTVNSPSTINSISLTGGSFFGNGYLAVGSLTVADNGGIYNGSPFSATGTVAGVISSVDTTPASSLEGVGLVFTYFPGSSAGGTHG